MQLKRESSGEVFAFEGEISCPSAWHSNKPNRVLITVNNVPYFQKRGRRYWTLPISISFCDEFENAKVNKMYKLMRASENNIRFLFTDRQEDEYVVQVVVRGEPRRMPNNPYFPLYVLDMTLYMDGYE